MHSSPGGWKIQGHYSCPGYWVIVFFRSGERTFFEYVFAKSVRSNISQKELKSLKQRARMRFAMTEEQIETALEAGAFEEI
jgi:hypothetical protein